MRVRYSWRFKVWIRVGVPVDHQQFRTVYRYLKGAGWMKMEMGRGLGWQPVL